MGAILVGVAGWSYPDWEGPVYPRAKGAGSTRSRSWRPTST
jgi:uncharacterized protein YecE (DUF72 family)